MNIVSIPRWNSQGILPPVNPADPTSPERSPYRASLIDLVSCFGITPERKRILEGFLNYRNALHSIGLVRGNQWINGSFLEHIEQLEDRAPRDIDAVTFYYLPDSQTQETLYQANPRLFLPKYTKEDYYVDGRCVEFEQPTMEYLFKLSIYWYSLCSHRRYDQRKHLYHWKGFLEIDLDPRDDQLAQANFAVNAPAPAGGES